MEDDDTDHAECDICADDHETRDCDQALCGKCGEVLDNCDCEQPEEITPEEWLRRQFEQKIS